MPRGLFGLASLRFGREEGRRGPGPAAARGARPALRPKRPAESSPPRYPPSAESHRDAGAKLCLGTPEPFVAFFCALYCPDSMPAYGSAESRPPARRARAPRRSLEGPSPFSPEPLLTPPLRGSSGGASLEGLGLLLSFHSRVSSRPAGEVVRSVNFECVGAGSRGPRRV